MLNVCLIGYGYWGSKLARNIQNSGFFNLKFIVDKNQKNLSSAKKLYGYSLFFNNYKKILNNSNIDLVIISTPTLTHYNISKKMLLAKKNILVEKPIALNSRQVISLENIAKQNKKKIFVDYPFLFSGGVKYIKEIMQKNTLGKIQEIVSFREQAPIRKDSNVIWDLAVHDISIFTYLLQKLPYKISTIKQKNYKNVLLDTAIINLKYKNNLNILIKNSWISPTKIRLIKIKFEKGTIYYDENESLYKVKIFKNKTNNHWDYTQFIPEIDLSEPLSEMLRYIYFSIKKNKNIIFKKKFNLVITQLLEKIDKN